MLIFIKVFHLLENCYFDSKCHFVQWYFGQECHFPSLNLHYTWYKFFAEIEQFFEKGVNLVVNSEKMAICFRSVNFFVMWATLVKSKILQKQQIWRIFFFFIFVANGHSFQKCSFLKDILSFFLKKYLLFLKSVNFWWHCKDNILCKKRQFLGKWVNFQVQW